MSFDVAADAYDRFMGRYSLQLSPQLADLAGVRRGQRVLDVGCGPGALTAELVMATCLKGPIPFALPISGAGRSPSKPSSGSDFVSRWDLMQTPARARFKRLIVAVLRGTDGLAVFDQSETLKGRNSPESVRAAKKALDPYTVQDRLPRRWSFGRRERP